MGWPETFPWPAVIRAVANHLWALGLVLVSVSVAAVQSENRAIRHLAFGAAIGFGVLFLTLAVVDVLQMWRTQLIVEELAKLRTAGRKRYTEWWTFCQDSSKSAQVEQEAEQMRLKVIGILRSKVSLAEADYFNTPKAAEEFPSTSLKHCPQAVLINEFGHRLDRLGEIIQRIWNRGRD